ncbi:MAG: hypothetical protein ABEK59_08665 [Halobacteria archaeon]
MKYQKQNPLPEDNSKTNQVIDKLRECPATAEELPRNLNLQDKSWVGTLKMTKSAPGSSKSRGRTKTVYYLYGDERRAVRKYIEKNKEFVSSCMDDTVNPINMSLEDYWWHMFCEEWAWGENQKNKDPTQNGTTTDENHAEENKAEANVGQ